MIRDTVNSAAYSNFMRYKPLIEYNWARENYRACTTLGYEPQCQIGEDVFTGLSKMNFENMGLSKQYKQMIVQDIETIPLRIAHAKLRSLFDSGDWITAAKLAEDLLGRFDEKASQWEKIGGVSKSRLYADAAVSWLHHADSLAPLADLDRDGQRCELYERSLYFAQRALWFGFRQTHVPVIERRIASCRNRANKAAL